MLELGHRLAGELDRLGFPRPPGSRGPILPVILGGPEEAVEASRLLEAEGLFVPAIRPPTVPKGTARLRISLSAAHSDDDLARLIAALGRVTVTTRATGE